MSSEDWTHGLWQLDGDRYAILVKTDQSRWPVRVAEVFDGHIEADEAMANARRIVAAINATRDCTTEGLESIVETGQTLDLALRASMAAKK